MNTHRLVIVGAGAFGRELMCWSDASVGRTWRESVWVDDNADALKGFSYAWPYVGTLNAFSPGPTDLCVVAAGEPATKKMLVESLLLKGARFATLVHPTAIVAPTARIGEGSVLCPMSFVSADADVGRFVTVNGLSSIGHDVVVGDYCTLSAHVDLTGRVQVGEGAFFGSGARVVPGVRLGRGVRIGAGATIMRNVADGTTMFSLPAKKL